MSEPFGGPEGCRRSEVPVPRGSVSEVRKRSIEIITRAEEAGIVTGELKAWVHALEDAEERWREQGDALANALQGTLEELHSRRAKETGPSAEETLATWQRDRLGL